MRQNLLKHKSKTFAVRIINLYMFLQKEKKKNLLSKQLLRSGTSVGANIRESEFAESKSDFIHKLAIAQKEINETIYWLELLEETNFISENQFESMNTDAIEIIKLITASIKTTKANIKN